jgi:hypothetical protein
MSHAPDHAHPNVQRSIELWHATIAKRDVKQLIDLLHPEAVFRSPMSVHKYGPRQAVVLALSTVIDVFEDFTYHRQLVSDDGLDVMLEFSARVGDKRLKGIDLFKFDTDGRILELEVMVRPINALAALGAEMGRRLGMSLPDYKRAD